MRFKEKLSEYKTYLIIVTIILGLIAFNIYTLTLVDYDEDEEIIPIKQNKNISKKIKVDIKGEINAPGVYELNNDDRVSDLINKAGGITKNGDTSIINLSKKLDDEMLVIIYTKDEVNKIKNTSSDKIINMCPKVNDACPTKELENIVEESKNETKDDKTEIKNTKISLNKASEEELQLLNGIGESKAKAIIKYREENGEFKKLEDIKNVSGIGNSAYEKIKDQITL